MQVGDKKFEMRADGFLPRHKTLECFHEKDNRLFGIKFRVSPVKIIKNINFAEYREYIFPLSYLMDHQVIEHIKKADSFNERVKILTEYFHTIIEENRRVEQPVRIVTAIMNDCDSNNDFTSPIEDLAAKYNISSRTLQRYFETCTGIGTKQALQVMRIRKATDHLVNSPSNFHFSLYGYYDHSHFSKHLRLFLQKDEGQSMNLHVKLLQQLHAS
jgi:AraC-like DNA-binding protein